MSYLIKTTEQHRCGSEEEAKELIQRAKDSGTLVKYSSELREIKSKGEVIDAYYRVILVKQFTNEKEPEDQIYVEYKVLGGNFE